MNKNQGFLIDSKNYIRVAKWLLPLLLVLFSFLGVNKGIDYTDTGYNLGNYTYLSGLDGMWYYSTLFSNFLGFVLVRLPGGSTMLGANIYCGLIKAGFALWSYLFFAKKTDLQREVIFVAEIISLGLWWIPNAGLYHFVSFWLFAIGAALIYEGLVKEDAKKFVVAGIALAANVFVRFPNLVQCGLIVVVWWYAILKKESFRVWIRKTLLCMAGYLGTLALVFGVIAVTGHFGDYVTAIKELFAMTGDAKKYGSVFMLVNLVNSYTCVWYWMIPIVLGCLVLIGLAFLPEKLRPLGYPASVAGFVIIYFWENKKGLFDYEFTSYSSIYLYMVVMLVLVLALLVLGLFLPSFGVGLRTLCMAALVIQLITPIGSNNSLYAVMNNCFFILPVALMVLVRMKDTKALAFVHSGLGTFLIFFLAQTMCFSQAHVFRDGFLGPVEEEVTNCEKLAGMKTESVNAVFLEEVEEVWEENDLSGYSILTYGDLPGFAYIFSSKPAISSTWPSLDSYSAEKFEGQIRDLEDRMREEGEKVVVCTDASLDTEGTKQEILKEFLEENDFIVIYDETNCKIWIQEESK